MVRPVGLLLLSCTRGVWAVARRPVPRPARRVHRPRKYPPDGQSPPTRPQREFRTLRTRLPGKNMHEVAALLGSPAHVFNMGDRESWDYKNMAYDSVTGRTVSSLSIWLTRRVADDVQAAF